MRFRGPRALRGRAEKRALRYKSFLCQRIILDFDVTHAHTAQRSASNYLW
jgi:hypothetical protein